MAEDIFVNNDFSIPALSSNTKFNFLHSIQNSTEPYSFSTFFTQDNNDSPYDSLNINCNYSSIADIPNHDELSVLSLNIQSLNAKYSELKDLVFELSLCKKKS